MTCVTHLLHNRAMKIKSYFEHVVQLIAKVKAVTIRNKTRQAKFSAIGYPPQPVATRLRLLINSKKFCLSGFILIVIAISLPCIMQTICLK